MPLTPGDTGLHIPDEGVVKGRDVDPAWVVLCQGLGQFEGLIQHLQDHREAGGCEGPGDPALPRCPLWP